MAVDADTAGQLTQLGEDQPDEIDETTDPAASQADSDSLVAPDMNAHDADEAHPAGGSPKALTGKKSGIRTGLVIGLLMIMALGGLAGWFGHRIYLSQQDEKQHQLFLRVGRQGAMNLTSINYADADADVRRILDSATGTFYDDFQKRSPAFVQLVKQAQSKTEGSVTEAGLESVGRDSARVLVAVTVKTSSLGATDQQPRKWRMRIDVQKVGDTVKVSNVGFVP
ncbi:hypothetical protein [Mycobacterium paraseoulense]|uniref:Mce protein n=1 Tax=Mycobacterium paraseoulense TaxID=590652 RepID=A0A1X0I828_9MYCO|nr:hypothetical protein [Mycobacterium paraseoulense]MCV7393953.1 mammalian cell entry protein [Mycobacterium paraseoulense]ORB38430.1 hypothetical protein BST39_17305 [Mycobacterium paraseoulense]BBZ70418.1 hypothetical protein MPRS_15110 [Mycobacterium paraseoulense]